MNAPTTPPGRKTYYDVLDGLRGLAALVILVFHYLEMIYPDDYETNAMGHGYLAVDFFFCLSGFVIAFAYDNRMRTLGVKDFFINRLIRLHPMVVFGTLFGFLLYVLDPFVGNPLSSGWGRILLTLGLSLLLIPSPLLDHRSGGLFPYNTPMWSLFFEYLANIAYAAVLCRLKKLPLLIAGILSALWLGYCAHRAGWIINGWAIQGFSDGFARVAFGFTAGMIVYRFGWIWNNRTGFILPALLLLGVFFLPHRTGDWLTETALIVLLFPAILAIGAGATVTGWVRRCCLFIGRLSYPLYLTHIPTVWAYGYYLLWAQPSRERMWLIAGVMIVVNVLFAYLVMRLYDEPVRRWLTRRHKAAMENEATKKDPVGHFTEIDYLSDKQRFAPPVCAEADPTNLPDMKRMLRIFALLALSGALFTGCGRPELVFFVSPSGSDTNPGTQELPFATLEKAHDLARYQAGKQPVTVCLREGTYYLSEPVVVAGPQSGKPKYPLRYTAYPSEKAVVSGARRLQGLHWEPYRDGILQTKIGESLTFDQLYLDGRLQSMARYPNYDSTVRHYHGYSADALSPERIKRWADPRGGYVHALHVAEWGGYQYRITGKDAQGGLQLEGGFQNNRQMGMHAKYRMVENIFEELDAPGEWYFDADSRTLYVWPPQGTDLNTALIEVPQLESLFRLEGTDRKPARYVEISGLELRHTLRTFMQTKEPLLRSDWTIYRGGAVFAGKSEHCTIRDCYIHDIGGNALFFSGYNRDARVEGNHITRAGASGVCFVGSPEAVRSPSFEYGQFVPTAQLDTIPGPKSEAYPARCTVHDNLIHDIGQTEKQTAAVEISMARGITVSHNSIYDLPRAGINISEGTWGGHLIEGNDVFNTVLETGDHGSFNSWGRDRFWLPDREAMDSINRHDPRLVGLDAVETTVIRNNRWRCDHGWDIDLDDGSSNYHLYDNLCLNGGIKLREGFHRTVENNIMVNNSFHSHAWFEHSGDIFRHNIVTRKYYPIGIEHWGRETDYNLLPDSASLLQAQANGTDRHSLAGNPRFIDPDRGDYRVEETSPALLIGFRNFPMDSFGVLSERLRALAKTPDLPRFTEQVWVPETDEIYRWMGASLKNITTEGERSAAGLDSPRGLFVIGMEAGSPMEQAGLRINDVVLGCNGRRTDRWADLKKELDKARPGERIQIVYYRHQHPQSAEITLP